MVDFSQIIFICASFITIATLISYLKHARKYTLLFLFIALSAMICSAADLPRKSQSYYLEAQIIHSDVEQTLFDTEQGVYIVESQHDPDYPYLLTMTDNGTHDKQDDEVVVVWRCDGGIVG